nr:uncharacterized protein LOC113829402 [Penaeus vannamei]
MEEIVATASVVLQESKYQEEEDQVIAGLIEEVLVMPEVQQQVYFIAWSLLYDTGRSLPHQEFLDLKKREEQLVLEPVAKELCWRTCWRARTGQTTSRRRRSFPRSRGRSWCSTTTGTSKKMLCPRTMLSRSYRKRCVPGRRRGSFPRRTLGQS